MKPSSDDPQNNHGLIDNNPALDYILYEEMNKDDERPSGKGGCLGFMLILFLPTIYFILHIAAT